MLRPNPDLDFGKDMGLMHQVAVGGRRPEVNMTKAAYTVLVENPQWFRRVANLLEHLAVLKQYRITIAPVSEMLAERLIQDVTAIINDAGVGACPCCFWHRRYHVAHLFVPHDVWEKDEYQVTRASHPNRVKAKLSTKYRQFLCPMISQRLREICLHPAELATFNSSFAYTSESRGAPPDQLALRNSQDDGCCCTTANDFAEVIRLLVAQRDMLSRLESF